MTAEKSKKIRKTLLVLRSYIIFFLMASFLITCCFVLFLHTVEEASGTEFERSAIETTAKATFANVILLSLLFTAIDAVRRVFMVNRPVKKITECAQKITSGDFNARIDTEESSVFSFGDFEDVALCFNKMAAELGAMETLQNDFTVNVSHEMKTPLAVIKNYCVLLASPAISDDERVRYAREAGRTVDNLNSLVTNILKLSKLENRQIYPQKTKYDLGEQLRKCVLRFENEWESRDIEIIADIDDNIYVQADCELLDIVWNNLFSNALKFTAKGSITVSLKKDGDFAVVSFKDTGCGISAEDGEKIFEKFYQADPSHATKGNGLGLALVKRVADIENARISVKSEQGIGSEFTVRLPL